MKTKILEKFKALYGDGAVCYASPGRVNLIGEHTDYNMGFCDAGRHRQGDLCGG
ncbi:MAG: galactokinase family protein [Alistipes indistinctus]